MLSSALACLTVSRRFLGHEWVTAERTAEGFTMKRLLEIN